MCVEMKEAGDEDRKRAARVFQSERLCSLLGS